MINFNFNEGIATQGIPSFLQDQKILDMYDNYPSKNIKRLTAIGTAGNTTWALKYKRMYVSFRFSGTVTKSVVENFLMNKGYSMVGIINDTSSWSGAYNILNFVGKDEVYIDEIFVTNQRKNSITIEFGYETSPGVLAYQIVGVINGTTPVALNTSSFSYPVKAIIIWSHQDGSSNSLDKLTIKARYNILNQLRTDTVNTIINNKYIKENTIDCT